MVRFLMIRLFDISGWISKALAVVCCVVLAVIAAITVIDVVAREIGVQLIGRVAVSEYGLLYAAMLGAPYLVRTGGHVFVDALLQGLPRAVRFLLEKAIYLLCIAICLYLGWFCLDLGYRALVTGDFDSRSFDMPRWLIYLPMVVGFFVCAVEFLRYLIGPSSMYERKDQDAAL